MAQEMQSNKLRGARPGPPTQRYLDIAEIREDVVVMKDGTLRAVLLVSSINFSLKSAEEQEATISGYVSFLNSLDHPIQIIIQSRRLNIDQYILRLEEQEKTLQNDLLRAQIRDYRSFVKDMITLGEIMAKRFYLVVPYDPVSNKRRGFFKRIGEAFRPAAVIKLKEKQFQERKGDLSTRVGHITAGLGSMGIPAIPLDTQSLIELYYTAYNPELIETQKLTDIGKLQVEL